MLFACICVLAVTLFVKDGLFVVSSGFRPNWRSMRTLILSTANCVTKGIKKSADLRIYCRIEGSSCVSRSGRTPSCASILKDSDRHTTFSMHHESTCSGETTDVVERITVK